MLQSTSISQRGAFIIFWCPGFYIRCSRFYTWCPGDAPWSSGSSGWQMCVSGSHGTVTNGETILGQLSPSSTAQTADWNTLPFFLWKRPISLCWSFGLRHRFLVWHITRIILRCSLEMETSGHQLCTLPLPHFRSLVSPGKELVHLSGTLIFVTIAQGTPLDHLALVASATYVYSPAYFKSCLPEGLSPTHPESRCWRRTSPLNTDRSCTPQLLGITKRCYLDNHKVWKTTKS